MAKLPIPLVKEEILTVEPTKVKPKKGVKKPETVTSIDIFGKEFGKCVGECIAKCLKRESKIEEEKVVPPREPTEGELKEISKKGVKLYEALPSPLEEVELTSEDIEAIIEESPIPGLVAEAIVHKAGKEREIRLALAERLRRERLEKEKERQEKLEKERQERIKKIEEDEKAKTEKLEKERQERIKKTEEENRKIKEDYEKRRQERLKK